MQRPSSLLENSLADVQAEITPENRHVSKKFLEHLNKLDDQLAKTANSGLIQKHSYEIKILNYHIIETFADSFSYMANQKMAALKTRFDQEAARTSDYKPETWPEIKDLALLQDAISKFFEEGIVNEEDHVKRQIIIERAINIAWKLAKYHDYFSAQAILIALGKTNTGVLRLINPANLSKRAHERFTALRDALPKTQNNEDLAEFRERVAKLSGKKILGNLTSITSRANAVNSRAKSDAINLKTPEDIQKSKEELAKVRQGNKALDIPEFNSFYAAYNVPQQKVSQNLIATIYETGIRVQSKLQIQALNDAIKLASDLLMQLEKNPDNPKFFELYNKFIKNYHEKFEKDDLQSLTDEIAVDRTELLRNARAKVNALVDEQKGKESYNQYENKLYEESKRRLAVGESATLAGAVKDQLGIVTEPLNPVSSQILKKAGHAVEAGTNVASKALGTVTGIFKHTADINEKDFENLEKQIHSNKNPADRLLMIERVLCRTNGSKYFERLQNIRGKAIFDLKSMLTELSKFYFSKLEPEGLDKFKTDSPDTLVSHRKLATYFNTLANMVQYSILQDPDPDLPEEVKIMRRAITMERWIEIMAQCANENDMNTALAINAAFRSSNITRLNKSYELLSPESKKLLENFAKIEIDAYKVTTARKDSLVPYHGSYTSQLALEVREGRAYVVLEELKKIHGNVVTPLTEKRMQPFEADFHKAIYAAMIDKASHAALKADKDDEKNSYQQLGASLAMEYVKLPNANSNFVIDKNSSFYHSEVQFQKLSDQHKKAESATKLADELSINPSYKAKIYGYSTLEFPELVAVYTNYKEILKKSRDLSQVIRELPSSETTTRINEWNFNIVNLLKAIDDGIADINILDITSQLKSLVTQLKEIEESVSHHKEVDKYRNATSTMEGMITNLRTLEQPFRSYTSRLPHTRQAKPEPIGVEVTSKVAESHPLEAPKTEETEKIEPVVAPKKASNEAFTPDMGLIVNLLESEDIRYFEKFFADPNYKNYDPAISSVLEQNYTDLLAAEALNTAAIHKELLTPGKNGPGLFDAKNVLPSVKQKMDLIKKIVCNEILANQPDLNILILERFIQLMTLAYNNKDFLTAAAIYDALTTSPISEFKELFNSLHLISREKIANFRGRLEEVGPNEISLLDLTQLNSIPSEHHQDNVWDPEIAKIPVNNIKKLPSLVPNDPQLIKNNKLGHMIRHFDDMNSSVDAKPKFKSPTPAPVPVDQKELSTIEQLEILLNAVNSLNQSLQKMKDTVNKQPEPTSPRLKK